MAIMFNWFVNNGGIVIYTDIFTTFRIVFAANQPSIPVLSKLIYLCCNNVASAIASNRWIN